MMIVNNSLVLATATTQQSNTAGENSGRTPFLQITSPAFNTLIINTTRQVFQAATLFDASGSEVDGQGGGDFGVEGVVGGETVRSAGGAAGTESEQLGSCHDWQDAQHTLFQLANLCIAVSLLTPATSASTCSSCAVCCWWPSCSSCCGAAVHLHERRAGLEPDLLPAGHRSHRAAAVPPPAGQDARHPHQSLSEGVPPAADVAIGVHSPVSRGSSGKIIKRRLLCHGGHDTLRAPASHLVEGEVTISASDDSLLLIWEYARLQEYLATQPFVCTLLHYLIGKDVCSQLYVIQERLLQAPDYMSTLASRHSSMVNLRSCLAANDSSSSLTRLALDLTGQSARVRGSGAREEAGMAGACKSTAEPAGGTQAVSPMTVETSV
ncbi:hypothetical protein C0Q70_10974 [Pomacea canaliculata]|uniref:Uncharacterized protein n=1 Tax=Pomacea canaliculata TaxID=400727 RepID=A0A2T7P4N8_POMCA|nr:hypothetical protein C0Q70_10974 [Pomacea canaliculata]